MPDYRHKLPKILWGAAFANTVQAGYPLDNVYAGDDKRAGSTTDQAPSGVEDAWSTGDDFVLRADWRWIPKDDTVTPVATGWNGATGVRAFLRWARDKNVIRFYPDSTAGTYIDCYLVEPMKGQGDPEGDGTRRLPLLLRNAGTEFDGY